MSTVNRDCELFESFILNISFKTIVSDFVICWANQTEREAIPNITIAYIVCLYEFYKWR